MYSCPGFLYPDIAQNNFRRTVTETMPRFGDAEEARNLNIRFSLFHSCDIASRRTHFFCQFLLVYDKDCSAAGQMGDGES